MGNERGTTREKEKKEKLTEEKRALAIYKQNA